MYKDNARKKNERRKSNMRKMSKKHGRGKGNNCRKQPEYIEKSRKFKRWNTKGNIKENINKNRKWSDCKSERS